MQRIKNTLKHGVLGLRKVISGFFTKKSFIRIISTLIFGITMRYLCGKYGLLNLENISWIEESSLLLVLATGYRLISLTVDVIDISDKPFSLIKKLLKIKDDISMQDHETLKKALEELLKKMDNKQLMSGDKSLEKPNLVNYMEANKAGSSSNSNWTDNVENTSIEQLKDHLLDDNKFKGKVGFWFHKSNTALIKPELNSTYVVERENYNDLQRAGLSSDRIDQGFSDLLYTQTVQLRGSCQIVDLCKYVKDNLKLKDDNANMILGTSQQTKRVRNLFDVSGIGDPNYDFHNMTRKQASDAIDNIHKIYENQKNILRQSTEKNSKICQLMGENRLDKLSAKSRAKLIPNQKIGLVDLFPSYYKKHQMYNQINII